MSWLMATVWANKRKVERHKMLFNHRLNSIIYDYVFCHMVASVDAARASELFDSLEDYYQDMVLYIRNVSKFPHFHIRMLNHAKRLAYDVIYKEKVI